MLCSIHPEMFHFCYTCCHQMGQYLKCLYHEHFIVACAIGLEDDRLESDVCSMSKMVWLQLIHKYYSEDPWLGCSQFLGGIASWESPQCLLHSCNLASSLAGVHTFCGVPAFTSVIGITLCVLQRCCCSCQCINIWVKTRIVLCEIPCISTSLSITYIKG
jgi:hypothetical protein